jgi:PEP-CTERM motif
LPSGDVSGDATTKTAMGSSPAASFANTAAALASVGTVVPTTDPTINAGGAGGEATYYMPQAQVKALGLSPTKYPTTAPYDGYIGFAASSSPFQFSFSGTPASGLYSFQAAAAHEIEEVLGRTSFLNNSTGTLYEQFATAMDLLRYTATGVSSYVVNTPNGGTQAYASIDGGATDLGTLADQSNGFDRTDWETAVNSTSTDAQNAILTPGVVEGLSISDEDVLKGLGYTIQDGTGLFQGADAPLGATPSVNDPLAAPEPASLSLLLVGAGLVAAVNRRSRRPVLA